MQKTGNTPGKRIRELFLRLLKTPWLMAGIAMLIGGLIWYELITEIDQRFIQEARFGIHNAMLQDGEILEEYIIDVENKVDTWYQLNDDAENPAPYSQIQLEWKNFSENLLTEDHTIISLGSITREGVAFLAPSGEVLPQDLLSFVNKIVPQAGWQTDIYIGAGGNKYLVLNRKNSFRNNSHTIFIAIGFDGWLSRIEKPEVAQLLDLKDDLLAGTPRDVKQSYMQTEIILQGKTVFLREYYPEGFEKSIRAETTVIKLATSLWVILLGVLFYHLIRQQEKLSRYAQNKTRELMAEFTERLQMEEDLEKNRAAFIEASRRAHIGYWECDILTDEFFWSDELYHLINQTPDTFKPTLETLASLILPEDLPIYEKNRLISVKQQKATDFEIRYQRQNGEIGNIWITTNPYVDANGKLKVLWGLAQDVTDLKQNERRLQKANQFLQMITQCDQLIVRMDDDRELLQEICRALANSGLFYLSWIAGSDTTNGDKEKCLASYSLHKFPLEEVDLTLSPLMEDISRQANEKRQPVLGHPYSGKAAQKQKLKNPLKEKCQTLVIIPLSFSDTSFGKLYMYADEHFSANEEDMQLLAALGSDISSGVRSIRNRQDYLHTLTALQQSEQKLNQIYQTSPDAIAITSSKEGRFIDVNPGFVAFSGFERDEVLGKTTLDIHFWVDPKDRERMIAQLDETGEVLNLEAMFQSKDGKKRTGLFSARAINVNGEKCLLSITRNISDRIEATRALQESEERLRAITESMIEAVYLTDLQLKPIYISPAAFTQRGYSLQELTAIPMEGQVTAESYARLDNVVRQVRRARRAGRVVRKLATQLELEFFNQDGSTAWYEVAITTLNNAEGLPHHFLFVGRNVSERRQMEAALKESEERWHYALEGSGDGVWDWHLPTRKVLFSHRWKEMLGYADEDISDDLDEWQKRVHPDDLEMTLQEIEKHVTGKADSYRTEFRMQCKDGSYIWILDRGKVISRDENGKAIRMVGVHTDLSEQKNLLKALEHSEYQFRMLAERSSDMISRLLPDGSILYTSPASERLLGYRPADMEKKYILDFIHPDDRSLVNYILSQIESGSDIYPIQYRMVREDGSIIWIESTVAISHSIDQPEQNEIQVTSRDISERVIAERALRDSEEKLRALITQSSDGIVLTDEEGRVIEWSRGQELITGLRANEVMGKYIWEVEYQTLPADERNEDGLYSLKQRTIDLLSQGMHAIYTQTIERIIQSPSGKQVMAQTTYFPIRTPSAYMTGAISRDITSLKAVEIALKKSEEQLRYITDNMLDVVLYSDADWKIQYISPSVSATLGYAPSDMVSNSIMDYMHPDDVQPVRDAIFRCIHKGETRGQVSYRCLNKTGVYLWMESLVNITYDNSGKFLGAVFGIRDISDRKLSSDALRESEARYRTLARNFPNGSVMLFDQDLRYTVADGAGLAEVGLKREILEGQTIYDIFTPETVRTLEPYYQAVLKGRTEVFELELGEKIMQFYAVPIRDEDGNINAGMVMTQDITDRKTALQALHDRAQFLTRLNEVTRVALETTDAPTYIKNITDLLALMFAADNCMLTTWDPEEEKTIPIAASGSLRETYPLLVVPPNGLTLTKSVLQKGEALIIPDLHHSECIEKKLANQFSLKSVLVLPLIGGGRKLGALIVGYNHDHEFHENEVIEASQVAGQVALGLYKQKLLDEIQLANQELENRVASRTADLEAKNKELETFTYSVSHDLKAPLRGIEGYSKLLLEDHAGQLDEEGKAFLYTIRQATTQMSRLIEDLLSYSRLERRSLTSDKVNLADMITRSISERQADLQQKKIRVVNRIPDEWVVIDQQALSQALRNIFDNAIKFSKKSGSAEIVCSLTSQPDAVVLSIADNGIGFDMKYNEKIFDIFQRLHLADDYPGTGIGLALVKKAMQRMGGNAWAESEPGKGSTFYLEFPRGG